MDQLTQYRDFARVCREFAEQAESDEERQLLEQMAYHWEQLAEILERSRGD